MDSQQVFTYGQQSLYILLMVSAPVLLTVLAVGLIVNIFQAATQIHEATLSFVPKIVAAWKMLTTRPTASTVSRIGAEIMSSM